MAVSASGASNRQSHSPPRIMTIDRKTPARAGCACVTPSAIPYRSDSTGRYRVGCHGLAQGLFNLPARAASTGSTGKRSSPLWRIHDPGIGHDNIRGRIPITIFIKTGIEAVAVVHVRGLREAHLPIACNLDMVEPGHLFIGFYLPHRQIARAHVDNLLVVNLGGNGIVADLADFMLAILTKFRAQQVMTITVMLVFRQSGSRDDQHVR